MSGPHMTTDPAGPASSAEASEELRARYPDVIRVAAGLAANPSSWDVPDDDLALRALGIVIECEYVCGIGGDA